MQRWLDIYKELIKFFIINNSRISGKIWSSLIEMSARFSLSFAIELNLNKMFYLVRKWKLKIAKLREVPKTFSVVSTAFSISLFIDWKGFFMQLICILISFRTHSYNFFFLLRNRLTYFPKSQVSTDFVP